MTPTEEIKLRALIAKDIWVARMRHPTAEVKNTDLERVIKCANYIVDNAIKELFK